MKLYKIEHLKLKRKSDRWIIEKTGRKAGHLIIDPPGGDETGELRLVAITDFPYRLRLDARGRLEIILEKGIGRMHLFRPIRVPPAPPVIVNRLVDKVFVVNLDRQPERYTHLSQQLTDREISHERFSAIDGELLSEQLLEGSASEVENIFALACLESHLKLIKIARERKHRSVLILEDDLLFHREFDRRLGELAVADWWKSCPLIYFGVSQRTGTWNELEVGVGEYRANQSNGTFAYLLRASAFDRVIEKLETRAANIDALLIELQSELEARVAYPNLIISDTTSSTIREGRPIEAQARRMRWLLEDYV